jgi:hypothetical protein
MVLKIAVKSNVFFMLNPLSNRGQRIAPAKEKRQPEAVTPGDSGYY